MKIKFSQLEKVFSYLRYNVGFKDDEDVEISSREENIGNGKIGDCIIVTVIKTEEPSSYDSLKSSKTTETTIEVFSDWENRTPRITVKETRELK